MASRYYNRAAVSSSDLSDPSDLEELYSVSEEEPTERDANDLRLTQAINYLAQEGGDDSAATWMHRVDRIDAALLQQLPQRSSDYDRKLYRRLKAMVRDVQREFEEAAAENSGLTMDVDDNLPDYHSAYPAVQALYREADEAETPMDAPSSPPLKPRQRHGKPNDKVPRQKHFLYGGPNNEVENWYRDMPGILPFPETPQMAHWESLKIDYDLSKPADAKHVETTVPFNHPQLEQYKNLSQYDSGSRYKLPATTLREQERVNRLGSEQRLKKVVDAFNKGDRNKEINKDYAPRVFLEKFAVGPQSKYFTTVWDGALLTTGSASPTALRRSMNVTPTKPRRVSNISVASSAGSSKRVAFERSKAAAAAAASAAFRRISDARVEALHTTPRRDSASATSKTPSTRRVVSAVEVPQKRPRGRPPKASTAPKVAKAPAPAPPTPVSAPPPTIQSSPKPSSSTTKALGKRKRSIGSETFTPDGKRKKSIGSEDYTPESVKKRTRAAVASTKKKVDFTDPLVSSPEEGVFPASSVGVKGLRRDCEEGGGEGKVVSKAAVAGERLRRGW
ncbi:hypothetical protein N0V83_002724 [Neocucurbitaria cava]|uniref:Uncharacterized protein n=1 Tax=Neocucurbitaria cava TaxID=798079 RepID=A0A9W8YC27_9PLEO|nr:hypothetical protein N0V83_002724 [Neocucurbitaria cava]